MNKADFRTLIKGLAVPERTRELLSMPKENLMEAGAKAYAASKKNSEGRQFDSAEAATARLIDNSKAVMTCLVDLGVVAEGAYEV